VNHGGDPWSMADMDDVDELIERYQLALDEFLKGNTEPGKLLWSHGEDVSLANPYNHPSASRVGDPGVDLPLERTS
jgi:hypothetical protein